MDVSIPLLLPQLNENMDVSHLGPEETNPHVLRVGWSTDDNNMLLGNQGGPSCLKIEKMS